MLCIIATTNPPTNNQPPNQPPSASDMRRAYDALGIQCPTSGTAPPGASPNTMIPGASQQTLNRPGAGGVRMPGPAGAIAAAAAAAATAGAAGNQQNLNTVRVLAPPQVIFILGLFLS